MPGSPLHRQRRLHVPVGLALAGLLAGCEVGLGDAESGESGAPLLGTTHPGFRNQHCENCHKLPVRGHDTTSPPQCASCHGGNGACNPNQSARLHFASDDCLNCHGPHHGFSAPAQCASCHFASRGVMACPVAPGTGHLDMGRSSPADAGGPVEGDAAVTDDGGAPATDLGPPQPPQLSQARVSNCMSFPASDYSSVNHMDPRLSLNPGDTAVELDLLDLNGTPHKLSTLLATKPVMMVFGAFT